MNVNKVTISSQRYRDSCGKSALVCLSEGPVESMGMCGARAELPHCIYCLCNEDKSWICYLSRKWSKFEVEVRELMVSCCSSRGTGPPCWRLSLRVKSGSTSVRVLQSELNLGPRMVELSTHPCSLVLVWSNLSHMLFHKSFREKKSYFWCEILLFLHRSVALSTSWLYTKKLLCLRLTWMIRA